jgi:hypothetical protein
MCNQNLRRIESPPEQTVLIWGLIWLSYDNRWRGTTIALLTNLETQFYVKWRIMKWSRRGDGKRSSDFGSGEL